MTYRCPVGDWLRYSLSMLCQLTVVSEMDSAVSALNGRFFGGRVLRAEKYDLDMFAANDLSG